MISRFLVNLPFILLFLFLALFVYLNGKLISALTVASFESVDLIIENGLIVGFCFAGRFCHSIRTNVSRLSICCDSGRTCSCRRRVNAKAKMIVNKRTTNQFHFFSARFKLPISSATIFFGSASIQIELKICSIDLPSILDFLLFSKSRHVFTILHFLYLSLSLSLLLAPSSFILLCFQ